jgi:hypothetical protein
MRTQICSSGEPGSTPWDEALREVFRHERRVVHEERVIQELF